MKIKMRKISINLTISILSIMLTLGILEIGARVYLSSFAPVDILDEYATYNQLLDYYGAPKLIPHCYLGFYPNPAHENHNSLGYRGTELEVPKPDGLYRIVIIGGSTIYSAAQEDNEKTYPYLLQEVLHENGFDNVEVVNAGVSGYTTYESLINLEFRIIELEPDLIIIYHGVNDVKARVVWPPSEYQPDNSGFREVLLDEDQLLKTANRASIIEQFTILRFAAIKLGLRPTARALLQSDVFSWAASSYELKFVSQWEQGIYPAGIFVDIPVEKMLSSNPPIYFERNMRSMIALAKEHQIDVITATFAHSPYFDFYSRSSSPQFQAALAKHNDILKRIAGSEIFLYDFSEEMPTDRKYYIDGIHFTYAGNKLRANMFADFIVQINLIPSP